MTSVMKISVLTPSYNQAHFLEENILSAASQGLGESLEHIVMDGGSTDGSVEILRKYSHLVWESRKDRGQSHALNKALAVSTGEIVGWVNSDDMLPPGSLSTVLEYFTKYPDRYVLVGGMQMIDEESRLLYTAPGAIVTYDGLLNGRQCVQQVSTFFRKEVFDKVGNFNESLHYCMDHDFFLRAAKEFKYYKSDRDLGTYRRYSETKTGSNPLGFIKERMSIRRQHGGNLLCSFNAIVLYAFLSHPFKGLPWLRKAIRHVKGLNTDFIHYS